MQEPTVRRLFVDASSREAARLAEILRRETVGGVLLAVAAVIALVWINSPWSDSYTNLRDTTVGPAALNLDLTLGTWAADGLLALFFFLAGLELKRELIDGDLPDPATAALPVAAALGGALVPAAIYLAVNAAGDGDASGWAIPAATDIAFALAVLAIVARNLPGALRIFLLTLAVVDDLLAITIIALFYTDAVQLWALAAAFVPLAAFGLLLRGGSRAWPVIALLAACTWVLIHESGVHATVAGVLLAALVPVTRSGEPPPGNADPELAERLEHVLRPVSAGFAVPVFALLSAGVAIDGVAGLVDRLDDPVTLGIVIGLVVGKPLGVLGSAALVARFTHAQLDERLTWWDVLGLSLLAGVGFTVSLLIAELAFGTGSELEDQAKTGILIGSLLAIIAAAAVLRWRERRHADARSRAT